MHLHSLEAKASEPGLMKRNPTNWLDFNANEREGEQVRNGERKAKRVREKWNGRGSSRNFFLLSSKTQTRSGTSAHPMEAVADWLWCKENILRKNISRKSNTHNNTSEISQEPCSLVVFWYCYLVQLGCHYTLMSFENISRFVRIGIAPFCYDGGAVIGLLDLWNATNIRHGHNGAIFWRSVKKKEARIREGVEWEEQMLYFSSVSFSHCGLKSWRDD